MSILPTPRELAARAAFERLFHDWRLADLGPGRDATHEAQTAWESDNEADRRAMMALAVVSYPVPALCCLRDKLDVLIRHASTAGEDMASDERLVLAGLCALRADIVHLGG